MKTAIKLTTGILATALMVGGTAALAAGQNPDAIDNARSVAKSLQQKQDNDSTAVLDAAGAAPAKPAPGAPAPAVKPAVIPGSASTPATAPVAKAAATAKPAAAAAKAKTVSSQNNQLQHVNVVPGGNNIQIEISSSDAVTPRVTKLNSPARVLVELPETVVATSQNKIPVGSGGVKGVRIGMDGKNPPTTSVVVDLDKPLTYDVSSGPAGKFALILHTLDGSTSAPTVAKSTATAPAKVAPVAAAKAAPAPKAAVATASTAKAAPAAKVAEVKAPAKAAVPAAAPKQDAKAAAAAKTVTTAAAPAASAAKPAEPAKPKAEEKKWAMNGKRDPFFSPVVQQQGSGCSTGKKCLEINAIALRGVVKSDNGFIAVVTNNIGKAYFLHENDPVFNGYVVKITGDSIVFEETVQDKLGKTSTHEVVKRIFTPAV